MPVVTPARALWIQRQQIADNRDRIQALMTAVGRCSDLAPFQWVQLLAYALEFRPDVILELGRERGNSTCCFLEAARLLDPDQDCKVVSLCLTDLWQRETAPRLRSLCGQEWFERAQIHTRDLLTYDFEAALAGRRRCLVFWDAHGFDIAECVLGRILPLLREREHVVVLHDMSDLRFDGAPSPEYDEHGLWKGERDSHGRFWLGSIVSHVAQVVPVIDFTTRNRIPLHAAGESMHSEFPAGSEKNSEMRRLLGDDLFSLAAHWFWFAPAGGAKTLVYPPVVPTPVTGQPSLSWLKPHRVLERLRRVFQARRTS